MMAGLVATDKSGQQRPVGSTASVVAVAPIGITTYDANGDRRRRRCPCGVATADVDVMMRVKGGARRR
jgi:hypothetical protein